VDIGHDGSINASAYFKPLVAKAAENFSRLPVVWLHFAECTGCSEAFLRSSYPNVDDILLETISLEYHETLMAASGYQAEQNLEKAVKDFDGKFICVIEGAIPLGLDGQYMRLGPKGKTGVEIAEEVAKKPPLLFASVPARLSGIFRRLNPIQPIVSASRKPSAFPL